MWAEYDGKRSMKLKLLKDLELEDYDWFYIAQSDGGIASYIDIHRALPGFLLLAVFGLEPVSMSAANT